MTVLFQIVSSIMFTGIILVICMWSLVHSNELSSDFPVRLCSRDADDFEECTKRTIEEAWPLLVAGIPDHKIPPLDPLEIEEFGDSYDFNILKGVFNGKNLVIYGLSKTQILSWELKLENDRFHLEAQVHQPKLLIEGEHGYDYESSFSPPVHAEGNFNNSLTNVTSMVVVDGSIIDDRMVLENVSVMPEIGDMKMWASDLYNGDKEMTAAILAISNTYWKVWHDKTIEISIKPVNAFLKDFLNNILATIPVSKVVM